MDDVQFERVWRNPDGTYGSNPVWPELPGKTVDELREEAKSHDSNKCACWRHRIVSINDFVEWEAKMEDK